MPRRPRADDISFAEVCGGRLVCLAGSDRIESFENISTRETGHQPADSQIPAMLRDPHGRRNSNPAARSVLPRYTNRILRRCQSKDGVHK